MATRNIRMSDTQDGKKVLLKSGENTKVINFTFLRETENTDRYLEDGVTKDKRGTIGSLYVLKGTFPTRPEKLTVTITAVA